MAHGNHTPLPHQVEVSAPARLHLGFVDMNGGLGRRFGSLGLTLEGLVTRVRVAHAGGVTAAGADAPRARRYAERTLRALGLPQAARVEVLEAIPGHIGLGSGTQLALAVGTALARLHGHPADTRTLARLLERGARSGIGIGAFDHGGFIVDGGRGEQETPPPVIAHAPFPAQWRVLLLLDRRGPGIHGEAEVEAFRALPPFPADSAAHLCRLLVMQALPALHEADCDAFGRAVAEIQRRVGDHFAPAQGGRFASPVVADALAWLRRNGVPGVGQSSWGPTGFALLPSEARAGRLAAELTADGADRALEVRVCRAAAHGAKVHVTPGEPQRLAL